VGDVGWTLMAERLTKARVLLEEAFQLDPKNADAARLMIDVELLDGGPEDMERWFKRAVSADPDDPRIYGAKLNWLEPKWHGSAEAMLEFGRECAKSGKWKAMIPMVLVDAHWAVGWNTAKGSALSPPRSYFENDPKIWAEIQPIYKQYLKQPETSNYHKTRYAVIAAYSGKWQESHAMFESLGNHWSAGVLYDNKAMQALIREAATNAAKAK
jgi:tetratricopeptide (TPR) repeat protein